MTKKKFGNGIPFFQPHLDVEDRKALKRVLDSRWLTTGREAHMFEAEFGHFVDSNFTLAVSSCTAALHLALELAGVRGKKVIVPSLTFTATAGAVLMAGATPIFADVNPDTLCLSAKDILAVDDPEAVAVMPVHYGGNPSEFLHVLDFAAARGLKVIDDAAHALPAKVQSVLIGSQSLQSFATCFSFYATKTITTAEGGMLALNDASLLERARRLSLHGIDADAYQRSRAGLYHYEVTEHGWKYNLPDLLAALGRSQLSKVNELFTRRYAVAAQYQSRFQKLVRAGLLTLPMVYDDCESSWHLYVIQFNMEALKPDWSRDRIALALREHGIGTSLHYRPLHLHPFWLPYATRGLPNTERAYGRMLSLPIYPGMTEGDTDRVADALEVVLQDAKL